MINILKNGRNKDLMNTWMWTLAFQCVVNIGVRGSDPRGADSRGSETIRTRVVEADVVPVLATILDNYLQTIEKARALLDESETRGESSRLKNKSFTRESSRTATSVTPRFERRRAPAPIEVPRNDERGFITTGIARPSAESEPQESLQVGGVNNIANRTSPLYHNHRHHHHHHFRPPGRARMDDLAEYDSQTQRQEVPQPNRNTEPFARPRNPLLLRDAFETPAMSPAYQGEANSSQPDTPMTPNIPIRHLPTTRRRSASAPFPLHAPAQQDLSMSGESDEGEVSSQSIIAAQAGPSSSAAIMDFQTNMNVDTMVDDAVVLDTVDAASLPAPSVTGDPDAETFNITHRSIDGSLIDPVPAPPNPALELSPTAPPFVVPDPLQLPPQPAFFPAFSSERSTASSSLLPCVPRDEDVIMSLQLLAYVSKYPSLRPYFQQTHLVPKLRNGRESKSREADDMALTESEDDNDEEYCQPDDYNIFPLVEKFTVRHHHHPDVNYWAGVVMRNLCRKDKSRGDIRQCAYYKCGKWEGYARQFAKCRRCRQTKYCSKECQKSAWVYHRHWCEPAQDGQRRNHACPAAPQA